MSCPPSRARSARKVFCNWSFILSPWPFKKARARLRARSRSRLKLPLPGRGSLRVQIDEYCHTRSAHNGKAELSKSGIWSEVVAADHGPQAHRDPLPDLDHGHVLHRRTVRGADAYRAAHARGRLRFLR